MELIRRALRAVLGWNSPAYRFGSELLTLAALIRSEGPMAARALTLLRRAAPGGAPEALRFARLAHPFYLRPGTKDVSVALCNFVREEYGAAVPAVAQPRVLLDGGAYIGDTSAYFLSRYPGLRTVALEPMEDSFEMARRNLAPYGDRVELHRAALTADGRPVRMSGVQTGARIGDVGDVEVQSMTIAQVLDTLPEGRINILKLDIEGAEGPIFANAPEAWLGKIDLIVVETHGPAITKTVLGALNANGWTAIRFRNLFFCRKA